MLVTRQATGSHLCTSISEGILAGFGHNTLWATIVTQLDKSQRSYSRLEVVTTIRCDSRGKQHQQPLSLFKVTIVVVSVGSVNSEWLQAVALATSIHCHSNELLQPQPPPATFHCDQSHHNASQVKVSLFIISLGRIAYTPPSPCELEKK